MAVKYLGTRDVPLEELTAFPGNARRGNINVIRESIRVNGQYRSLVVRDTGDALVILAGNHTEQALGLEGYKTARCDVVECSDEEATRIVLADNKTAEYGVYEEEQLLELLESLGDLDGTGYTPDDLEDLLAELDRVVETQYVEPTNTYTESPEELEARRNRVESMVPQEVKGVRETVLILPQEEHDELHRHLNAIRKGVGESDMTNGETVLRAARAMAIITDVHSTHEPGCSCEWCSVARKTADAQE